MVKENRPPRLRQLLGRLFAFSGLIIIAAGVAGGLAYKNLLDDRRALLERIDPANAQVSQLLADYLDQETAVRGYALSQENLFLDPYDTGRTGAAAVDLMLTRLLPTDSPAGELLAQVHARASAWTNGYAEPSIAATRSGNPAFRADAELTRGKDLFDSLRQSLSNLQNELSSERQTAQHKLTTASDQLLVVMMVSLAVIVIDGLIIWLALERMVLRPLEDLGADARRVAEGHLEHQVAPTGPLEIAELATDIEAMRGRVFAEVGRAQEAQEQLETTNLELARSNEDLEQFAYVASHDLQEPLRKVASFCQLLEQRYGTELDERGRQYIAFAVDGAKRMQVLINDLLAFSRIGRSTDGFAPVPLRDCLEQALRNLSESVESTGARIDAPDRLPEVLGDRTLLVALLQNLIGNAVKFRGTDTPEVRVSCQVDPDNEAGWLLSVADNGIGIEARFAERIFVIFQRLHGRETYAGTGIGLALCRKIVEFHGGHIWLDTDYTGGTRFCFTLPSIATEEPTLEPDAEPADLAPTADS